MDPKHLPNVVRVGIAPAMKMDPTRPYWEEVGEGDRKLGGMDEKTKRLIGCRKIHTMRYEVREFFREDKGNGITARELIQNMTMTKGCKHLPLPGNAEEEQHMLEKTMCTPMTASKMQESAL